MQREGDMKTRVENRLDNKKCFDKNLGRECRRYCYVAEILVDFLLAIIESDEVVYCPLYQLIIG